MKYVPYSDPHPVSNSSLLPTLPLITVASNCWRWVLLEKLWWKQWILQLFPHPSPKVLLLHSAMNPNFSHTCLEILFVALHLTWQDSGWAVTFPMLSFNDQCMLPGSPFPAASPSTFLYKKWLSHEETQPQCFFHFSTPSWATFGCKRLKFPGDSWGYTPASFLQTWKPDS